MVLQTDKKTTSDTNNTAVKNNTRTTKKTIQTAICLELCIFGKVGVEGWADSGNFPPDYSNLINYVNAY